MTDSETYCSAASLIRIYGEGAAMEAAMQADKMQARQDGEGQKNWERIALAVREIQNGGSHVL